MSSKSNKKELKNSKALFSIICLCIISLGLVVYFSTNSRGAENDTVNEATTIEETTEVQHPVTVKETTTKKATVETTKKQKPAKTTTEPATMEMQKTNTPYKSFYKYPLSEKTIKGYSEELVLDETMGDYRAHAAIDFAGKKDDEVVAINDGLVLNVYTDNLYGTCVEIDHGGKLVVKYCGLKSTAVKKGAYVNIGNLIGTVGTVPCESTVAPHIHLEAKLDGQSVNPLDVMGKTE